MGVLHRTSVLRFALSVFVFSLLNTVSTHDVDFDEVNNPVKEDPEVTIENVDDDVPEVEYFPPVPSGSVHFAESFDDFDSARKRWVISRAQKSDQDTVFKYNGQWDFDLPERPIFPLDKALILKSKAAHAAIAAKMEKRFDFNTKPLYVQYEVNFQHGMDCGGAYIKLLSYSKDLDLNNFHDKTPYSIMFGPDKCGNDIKIHFIFRHKNPINGTFEEKHAKRPSNRMEEVYSDKKPHLYRLVLTPDNKFEVYVDEVRVNRGSLLTDMTPPINPPEEIEDPNDQKPADWDEREKIPDITASKPEDWDEDAPAKIPDPSARKPEGWLEDEPEMIPDENAVKPEDWDNEMDGPWEPPLITNPNCKDAPGCGPWIAPLIENPAFKGVWKPPLIPNPHYKGKWAPRKIPNPDFFEDKEPFRMTPISAVGLEIWTMTDGVLFDNFIITDDEAVLEDWTAQTYAKKKLALDRDSNSWWGKLKKRMNYRVGAWSAYFIYCAIPICLYFGYLLKLCLEEKKIADHKKTDAVTEDSVAPEQPGKGATKTSPAASSRRRNKVEVSRSKEELEAKKSSDNESELSENSVTKTSIGDTEVNERSASNKAASSSSASDLKDDSSSVAESGDAPRKRRARKD